MRSDPRKAATQVLQAHFDLPEPEVDAEGPNQATPEERPDQPDAEVGDRTVAAPIPLDQHAGEETGERTDDEPGDDGGPGRRQTIADIELARRRSGCGNMTGELGAGSTARGPIRAPFALGSTMSLDQRSRSIGAPSENALSTVEAAQLLDRCIHCGLCLPACPTYAVFRHEMDGPRGRIALMRGVAEGRIEIEGAFTRHIDLCVGCLACVTACPSGVEYGELLGLAQRSAESVRRRGPLVRFGRWLVFRQLLPHPRRLRLLAAALRLARAVGLLALARSRLAPRALRRLADLAPSEPRRTGAVTRRPEPASGAERPRVTLFSGCIQEAFFGRVNVATRRLLELAGYDVVRPSGQTCCGALALHCGDERTARELARRNVESFDADGSEAVVTNAGGCGAMLERYPRLLRGDVEFESRARELASRIHDVAELLEGSPAALPAGRLECRVTYTDSCHLRHGQGVAAAPRRLLSAIVGLELVELMHPDRCCGSGAAYNLLESSAADRLLDLKMAEIRASGANLVVSSNPGCQLQLEQGARRAGLDIEVLHLVELLERAVAADAARSEGPP